MGEPVTLIVAIIFEIRNGGSEGTHPHDRYSRRPLPCEVLPRPRKSSRQRRLLQGNVSLIPRRKQIVSGGADGLVEVWNFKPQIRPFKFVGHKGQVNDVLFNADSSKVISCGDDREIRIWKNSV